MIELLRVPHGYLRRHLSTVERGLTAAGIAILLYWLLTDLPAYPSPWEVVVAITVFFVMFWSPTVAYFLAVTASLYPLYTISLYLAVLFLVVALLGHRLFISNLGALILILLVPWLPQYHLAWLVPLLAGIWWGKTGGAWVGAAAALWCQLLFGMAGAAPDLLSTVGTAPSISALVTRFAPANSLETLKLIFSPLGANPTLLLYHLLQVTLWAMTAALVGGLAERRWVQENRPLRTTVVLFAGALCLLAGHLGLAAWLDQYQGDRLFQLAPQIVLEVLAVTVAAAVLEALRDFVEHPLPVRQPLQRQPEPAPRNLLRPAGWFLSAVKKKEATPENNAPVEVEQASPGQEAAYPPVQVPVNLPRRDGKKQKPDDIIKIELD